MIRIVLVDDHELVRAGFRLILSGQPDIEVAGEAGNAEDGLRLIRAQKPDVALVDVHMPGMSGIELTERVHRADLPTRIVILTVVDDARFPRRLLQSGALGYVTKACPADELLLAVRNVAQGKRYLDAAIARQMALAAVDGEASPLDSLSSRELEVALMLARGSAVNEIAERLHLSPKTVSTYKQRLFEKLDVEHTIALAHLLSAHGLLDGQKRTPPATAAGDA
ncbi:MAG: response regulator [Proteobacteria bacterium]|nr:response regulator [Pseudomonadota bacterium]